jgi:hypothetical protein
MPPAGLEPAIPASEWPQTHALDSAAAGIGVNNFSRSYYHECDESPGPSVHHVTVLPSEQQRAEVVLGQAAESPSTCCEVSTERVGGIFKGRNLQ